MAPTGSYTLHSRGRSARIRRHVTRSIPRGKHTVIVTQHLSVRPFRAAIIAVGALIGMTTTVRADDTEVRPPAKGERIVFLGDSITQAGDKGRGYVVLVREAIAEAMPDASVEVIGAGISGHKVPDLQKRLDRDVIEKKPTTVVIYIGINDVWHSNRGQGTAKDVYEKGLRNLVDRIRAAGSRVILCTPSVIGEKATGENSLDAMLDEYSDITRTVAADMKTGLVDLRKAFVDHLAKANPEGKEKGTLTNDGVHLNPEGNRFVADRMLEGLGVAVAPASKE